MNWTEFEAAHEDAKRTVAKANSIRQWALSVLVHNLRTSGLDPFDLAELKRELKSFDIRSGEWR